MLLLNAKPGECMGSLVDKKLHKELFMFPTLCYVTSLLKATVRSSLTALNACKTFPYI